MKSNNMRILRTALSLGLCGLAALGVVHMGSQIFVSHDTALGLDFRLVWLAGKLWLSGENPYSSAFARHYLALFGPSINMYWSYPPWWYPISAPLGLAPFDVAFRLWLLADTGLTVVGTWLVARAVALRRTSEPWPVFLVGLAFACTMQATEIAIYIGQTSFVVYFGLAAVISGLLTSKQILVIVGLFFMALKPHLGLVAFISVLALPNYRWTTVAAGALCLLAATGTSDYVNTFKGFIENLALYAHPGNSLNNPENLTGVTNIVNALFDTPSNSLFSVFLALVASAGGFVALWLYRDAEASGNQESKLSSLMVFVALTLLFVPLHAYDMVPLTIVLILGLFITSVWKYPILVAAVLCNHPRVFAVRMHLVNPRSLDFPESLFLSVMLIVILVSSIGALAAARRSTSAQDWTATRPQVGR
jgi:hypothetical protein